jgi:NitT/TauT family transport system permease protein
MRPIRITRRNWVLPIIPLIAFIGIWWLLTETVLTRSRVFAPPADVLTELLRIARGESPLGSAYMHLAATLYRLAAAFLLSFVLGSTLGMLAGRSKLAFDLLDNMVWIFLAVPSIIWVFIFAVALGIGDIVPIVAVSALLTPLVLVIVAEGAKTIPLDLLQMANSYKIIGARRITAIYLPYLVPYFVGAARTSLAIGVKIVIVAEVIGLSSGIGYLVAYWRDAVQMAPIAAWGVVLIGIGLLVDFVIFGPIERRVSRWRGGGASAEVSEVAV